MNHETQIHNKSRLSVEKKWSKMYKKGKMNYIFFNTILCRYIPLMLVFSIIHEVIYRDNHWNIKQAGLVIITKIVLSALLGAIFGLLDWYFYQNLFKGIYKDVNYVEKMHIFIYGILGWGLLIAIGNIDYTSSALESIVQFLLWIVSGGILGYFIWKYSQDDFKKYIK